MKISRMGKPKVIVVMPAYYAEKTVSRTFQDIPKNLISEVILVDDGSKDDTVKTAKKLGLTTFAHPNNLGYGGNQKTCYWEAMKKNPDVVVMLHPDYQYDGTKMKAMIDPIVNGEYDIMIGSRIRTRQEALEGGMPFEKYLGNRVLTAFSNVVLGLNLSEHLSGFRAYSLKVLKTVPFQRFSNDFVFDQQFTASATSYGFRIGETPVPVRYFKEASSISGWGGIKFVLESFWVLFCFFLHRSIGLKSDLFN
jgi:glycosyltransferase involved in cell wall biosynthesis